MTLFIVLAVIAVVAIASTVRSTLKARRHRAAVARNLAHYIGTRMDMGGGAVRR